MQREANKRMHQRIDVPKAGDDYLPVLGWTRDLMIHHQRLIREVDLQLQGFTRMVSKEPVLN